MITRDEIREISEVYSPEGCALTFYYQPATPFDKSHRHEAILVKDLVREAISQAELSGKNRHAREDLRKILALSDQLQGNGKRAKAIFACGHRGIWREYDLPPVLKKTGLSVNSRFHLKPLVPVLEKRPRVVVALIDRSKARLLELIDETITEKDDFFSILHRRGDGFKGYDAGHAERHELNDANVHFKTIADQMLAHIQRENIEKVAIGTHDELWSEIKPNLHTYTLNRLTGQFRIDPKSATPLEAKEKAEQLLAEEDGRRKLALMREVIDEAGGNGLGALGLRRVLRSMEMGEVQTLLLEEKFAAPGTQCTNCGHIDISMTHSCNVCGQPTIAIEDIADVLIGRVLAQGIELVYVASNGELDRVGRIAAKLRFRADQNTAVKQAS